MIANSTQQKSVDNFSKSELIQLVEAQSQQLEKLLKIDEKYLNWFETSIDGLYQSTEVGKFINVNSALVKMLGYNSKEELLAIDINTQLYLNKTDRKASIDEPVGDSKKIQSVLKKDGSLIWVEDYTTKVTDKEGNFLYFEGVVRDVTLVRKAKKLQKILFKISQESYKTEKLRDFNQFIMQELDSLIDTTNFYIAFYNDKKNTLNIPFITGETIVGEIPADKTMTGYLIKKNVPILLKSNEYNKLIEEKEIELIGTFPKCWLGVPIQINDKVFGAIVVQSYTDENAFDKEDIELLQFVSSQIGIILHQKKIAQENAISKEVLRKVLDNIPIRVYWKDKDSKFLGCNKAYLDANNLTSESDIIGKDDFDMHDFESAKKFRADEVEMMEKAEAMINFREFTNDKGKVIWFRSNKLPYFDNGKVIGVIGTSEDITEKLEDEIKLKKATEEAIAANLSKSTFLANMSHEIRTPMNAILGYSQLLQEDENLTKEQQNVLKTINKSGEHLLALINDILDMSKIEAGRITLTNDNFNFIEVLKEIEQLFKNKAASKNLDLMISTGLNVPKFIVADEFKIKQIIINLVGNAIKFTDRGYVNIMVNCIGDKTMKISVKDSGKGIAKEEHETVFKPFEQAKIGGEVKGGTGLGLAISKKFAHLMGGDITIESEFERGATFNFTFNFSTGEKEIVVEEKKQRKVVSLAPEMKGVKVAVVDDRFENRDILYKKLNPLGFDIKMAENGLEAVELYENWKPDIVLMDVVMPVMNGVEATRIILEKANGHDVKVFVVSASALESEQQEVMKIGATVFIKKPVIFNDLIFELQEKAHIKFVYKDEIEGNSEGNNAVYASDVPLLLKAKIIKAATMGDFMLLQELQSELEKDTKKSFKFIEDCINEMEFEKLIGWLKS